MATMNISLPEPMRKWVELQSEQGLYANNSDYVRDLIRRDQTKADKIQALQMAITKGLESGTGDKSMDDILTEARSFAERGTLKKHRNGD